jgi:hypothetical protein
VHHVHLRVLIVIALHRRRLGKHFPRNPHSRDAAHPAWANQKVPNPNTLCGGVVSGPYNEAAPSSGTDVFTDMRFKYQSTEAAIDYSASIICAMGGFADLPKGTFSDCSVDNRSPLAGRAGV